MLLKLVVLPYMLLLGLFALAVFKKKMFKGALHLNIKKYSGLEKISFISEKGPPWNLESKDLDSN